MDDVEDSLTRIKDITSKINETIQQLKNIQKGIDIAACLATLGAAIISKSPVEIYAGISNIEDILNG